VAVAGAGAVLVTAGTGVSVFSGSSVGVAVRRRIVADGIGVHVGNCCRLLMTPRGTVGSAVGVAVFGGVAVKGGMQPPFSPAKATLLSRVPMLNASPSVSIPVAKANAPPTMNLLGNTVLLLSVRGLTDRLDEDTRIDQAGQQYYGKPVRVHLTVAWSCAIRPAIESRLPAASPLLECRRSAPPAAPGPGAATKEPHARDRRRPGTVRTRRP
jgi:hypothetical protein